MKEHTVPDTTSATVSGDTPNTENKDPLKVTKAEHDEAVQAVRGEFAPVPPEEQEGVVRTTRDLPSEQAKTATLVDEVKGASAPFTATIDGDEREQEFVHTLANGKTEAVVKAPAALPTFPPDDGGYNPEKRTHAGPAGTITPQAATAHEISGTAGGSDVPHGFRESDRVKSSK
jgi:hypothetical protein